MQLNENTLKVLQNFASINPNMLIREQNTLNSLSGGKSILAEATLDQDFPKRFGLYDMGEFLSVISILDDHHLTFNDDHLVVSDGTGLNSCKYYYASEEILTFTEKSITLPDEVAKFNINSTTLNRLRRAASALGHEKMSILPSENGIKLSVVDVTDPTSNSFDLIVPGSSDIDDFKLVANIGNLKMIEGDYEVSISSKMITEWKKDTGDIKYIVALEPSSTYGE